MKKHYIIFGLVTVAVLIAAVVAVNKQQSAVVNEQAGAYLFPGLEAKANDVAKVEVVQGDDKVTVVRGQNGWQVAEKDNYPANLSKVKETVMQIAGFTTIEAKTKKAENYASLKVEDATGEDADSVLVTLKDEADKPMASVIIGRQISGSLTTVGQDRMYVRKNDDPQAWLVKGALIVDEKARDWLVEDLMNVSLDRVSRIAITQPGEEPVVISKPEPGDRDFIIENLPKNKTVKSQSELSRVARVLENLRLEDVRKADTVEFPGEETVNTEIRTFDGLVISAMNIKQNRDYLVKLSVEYDPAVRFTPPAGDPSGEAQPQMQDTGTTPAEADPHGQTQHPQLKDEAAVQQEAAELNAKFQDWVFEVSRSDGQMLTKKLKDLVKDKS